MLNYGQLEKELPFLRLYGRKVREMDKHIVEKHSIACSFNTC